MGRGLSDYEIGIIKALIKLKISNQKILGYINHRRGNVGNHINSGRITDIKNRKIGADISPASEKEAKEFIEQYGNPIQNDKELDEILRVDENNPDFLVTQESERVEFKKSFGDYKKILETIHAMANNSGGYILFGIEEIDSEKGKKGRIIGVEIDDIKRFNCDAKEITYAIESLCDDEIKYHRNVSPIGDKEICILQIFESENKPIVNKNGQIKYRYGAENKLIKKIQLEHILQTRMNEDVVLNLSRHIEQILKNGIENSAILNITTGNVEGKGGSFLIDESLLPKIAFIKEGEFVETKGAPARILKGEIKPYNAILKTEQK